MASYLNKAYLINKKNKNMLIAKALLKYTPQKFNCIILEYIDNSKNKNKLTDRETYYLTLLKPYYNILKYGKNSLGFKHSEQTKLFLSNLKKNTKLSDSTKNLISESLKGENNPFFNKKHTELSKQKMRDTKLTNKLYIYNINKELLYIAPSIKSFSKEIRANAQSINNYLNKNKLFRGLIYFSNINNNNIPIINNNSTSQYKNLIQSIIQNIKIKKPIYIFNSNFEFLKEYNGIMEAEKDLNVRHEIIKLHALNKKLLKINSNKNNLNYIFVSYKKFNNN